MLVNVFFNIFNGQPHPPAPTILTLSIVNLWVGVDRFQWSKRNVVND